MGVVRADQRVSAAVGTRRSRRHNGSQLPHTAVADAVGPSPEGRQNGARSHLAAMRATKRCAQPPRGDAGDKTARSHHGSSVRPSGEGPTASATNHEIIAQLVAPTSAGPYGRGDAVVALRERFNALSVLDHPHSKFYIQERPPSASPKTERSEVQGAGSARQVIPSASPKTELLFCPHARSSWTSSVGLEDRVRTREVQGAGSGRSIIQHRHSVRRRPDLRAKPSGSVTLVSSCAT
jgi:hypothetical protein